MKKLIEPAKPEISEYYCDGCKKLVLIDGLPEDKIPQTNKKFGVALQVDLGYNGNTAGLFANLDLCEDCGWKLVKATETLFNLKIESPQFEIGDWKNENLN